MENYENINNNYQNPYYGEDVKPRNTFGKSQMTLLARAMLIAGIGFVIICGLSVLFTWAFSFLKPETLINSSILFPVVFGNLLISMLISILWMKVLGKGKSTGLTVLIFSLYSIFMSVGFGFLFARLRLMGYNLIFLSFGVAGIIFLLIALVAKLIGLRGMVTFGKIIGVVGAIAGAASLALLITMLITGFRGTTFWTVNTYSWLVLVLVSLSMFFYIIIDIKVITMASEFNEYSGIDQIAPAIVWYFGFKLLSDIINVLFWAIVWITRIARR